MSDGSQNWHEQVQTCSAEGFSGAHRFRTVNIIIRWLIYLLKLITKECTSCFMAAASNACKKRQKAEPYFVFMLAEQPVRRCVPPSQPSDTHTPLQGEVSNNWIMGVISNKPKNNPQMVVGSLWVRFLGLGLLYIFFLIYFKSFKATKLMDLSEVLFIGNIS